MEKWLLARIRNETFHTLRALNIRFRELLTDLNSRPMKNYGNQSRAERFRTLDAPSLSPLPLASYEYSKFRTVKVGPDTTLNMPITASTTCYAISVKTRKYRRPVTMNTARLCRWSMKTCAAPATTTY